MKKINIFRVIFVLSFIFIIPMIFLAQFKLGDTIYNMHFNEITVVFFFLFSIALDAVFIVFLIKLYRQISAGQKVFSCFKKNENFTELDILYTALLNQPHKEIFKNDDSLVFINNVGKYVIKQIKGKGILSGNIKDAKWKLRDIEIDNPFNNNDNNFILKSYGILYNVYGVGVYDISQIIFKIENGLLNKKN